MNVAEEFSAVFVSGEFRRNIYLAVKEALHNIVKHAQAHRVKISIEANKELNILIHDDGVGLSENNLKLSGNGIPNMKKRIASLKGRFLIKNQKGTIVILSVPLEN